MGVITEEQLLRSMQQVRTQMKPDLIAYYLRTTVDRFRETFAEIPPNDGDQMLIDIGCYGPVLGPLHELLGYRRIGAAALYDWGPLDSKVLPKWAEEQGLELSPWFGDVEKEKLPWASDSADVALLLEILEHFTTDPMHALCEANRVLRVGGKLVLSTPNAASAMAVVRVLAGNNPHPDTPYNGCDANRHNRLYDETEIRLLLEAAGFGDIQIRSIGRSGYRLIHKLVRIGAQIIAGTVRLVGEQSGRCRGKVLLATARKKSEPVDRYPDFLYGDMSLWDDWREFMKSSNRPL